MRDWWKHSSGYLKIDDEFIYFTSIGNLTDTQKLGELNEEKTKKKNSTRKYKLISYFVLTSLIVGWIIWQSLSQKFDPLILLTLLLFGYMAYQYMSPDLYQEYKIAYSSITKLEVNPSMAKITFLDFNEQESIQEVTGLDQKGFDLFIYLTALLDSQSD